MGEKRETVYLQKSLAENFFHVTILGGETRSIPERRMSMSRLNTFQKDLLVLVAAFVLHVALTALFTPTSDGVLPAAEIIVQWFAFRIEDLATGETFTFIPVLPLVYAVIIVVQLFLKEKSLTLIYGLAIVLFAQITFYSQIVQLAGVHERVLVEGFLFKRIYIDDNLAAQDASAYVMLILLLIATAIVLHGYIKKRLRERKGFSGRGDNVQTL